MIRRRNSDEVLDPEAATDRVEAIMDEINDALDESCRILRRVKTKWGQTNA